MLFVYVRRGGYRRAIWTSRPASAFALASSVYCVLSAVVGRCCGRLRPVIIVIRGAWLFLESCFTMEGCSVQRPKVLKLYCQEYSDSVRFMQVLLSASPRASLTGPCNGVGYGIPEFNQYIATAYSESSRVMGILPPGFPHALPWDSGSPMYGHQARHPKIRQMYHRKYPALRAYGILRFRDVKRDSGGLWLPHVRRSGNEARWLNGVFRIDIWNLGRVIPPLDAAGFRGFHVRGSGAAARSSILTLYRPGLFRRFASDAVISFRELLRIAGLLL